MENFASENRVYILDRHKIAEIAGSLASILNEESERVAKELKNVQDNKLGKYAPFVFLASRASFTDYEFNKSNVQAIDCLPSSLIEVVAYCESRTEKSILEPKSLCRIYVPSGDEDDAVATVNQLEMIVVNPSVVHEVLAKYKKIE